MTPLSVAHTELRLFVTHIEREHASVARAQALRYAVGDLPYPEAWENHRTAALGQLWETLDRVEHGLGLRLMKALFAVFEPEADDAAAPAFPPITGRGDAEWAEYGV